MSTPVINANMVSMAALALSVQEAYRTFPFKVSYILNSNISDKFTNAWGVRRNCGTGNTRPYFFSFSPFSAVHRYPCVYMSCKAPWMWGRINVWGSVRSNSQDATKSGPLRYLHSSKLFWHVAENNRKFQTRHRASTSMYSLTFRVRVMLP